ncbi:MAG: hypothetical protein JWQ51_3076 [Tardiphaga sp.]|nr:hypothetical protein [Tardiphaga sp.]MDB5630736.1 hypothetical protein [Tardiphaga sp.]
MAKPSLVTIRPRRPQPVFVCKKCLTRVPDGAKLRRSLKSELKRRASAQGMKSPRVVPTSCLGICPKRAVVIASAATLHRGAYLLLADRDGIADAVQALSDGA